MSRHLSIPIFPINELLSRGLPKLPVDGLPDTLIMSQRRRDAGCPGIHGEPSVPVSPRKALPPDELYSIREYSISKVDRLLPGMKAKELPQSYLFDCSSQAIVTRTAVEIERDFREIGQKQGPWQASGSGGERVWS